MEFHSLLTCLHLLSVLQISYAGMPSNFKQSSNFSRSHRVYPGHSFPNAYSKIPRENSNNMDISRPVVSISSGRLRGFKMKTVNGRVISAFQSIPFATAPIGPLRFKDPVENKPWIGTLDAVAQSPQCIQVDLIKDMQIHGQEDCLYLNVYVPQEITSSRNGHLPLLPVMVWIHGGSLFFGAGSGSIYGPRYLLDHDVCLVTLNYRLGPLGFLSTGDDASPGNQGMKDQVLALQWVRDNIASFGGHPNSVTIFGNSAGGSSVGLHITSPSSRGLFHRAITQSGSALMPIANTHNASVTAEKVGELLGCPVNSTYTMVECLRKIPASRLASVQLELKEWYQYPLVFFGPTVEHNYPGAFMLKTPEQYYIDGEASKVPLISGLTSDEFVWTTSLLMQDPAQIDDINNDWDRVGPIFLKLDYNTTEVNVRRVRRIWDFYMGNRKLGWETRFNIAKMESDRQIVEGSLEAMRYHSLYTNQSVYAYIFSYEGKYSNVEPFGGEPEDWGVSHMDDLIYLLNNTDYYGTLNAGDPDIQMSRMMSRIWSSFASSNWPHVVVGSGNTSRDIWQPIEPAKHRFSPLRFLDLNLNPKMIADPYVQRYNFWRHVINPNP